MNRRGFLKGILLAGIAPAIIRADSLMRAIPTETTILPAGFLELPPIGVPLSANKSLWPGVKHWWAIDYGNHMTEDFTVLVGGAYDKETNIITVTEVEKIALSRDRPF